MSSLPSFPFVQKAACLLTGAFVFAFAGCGDGKSSVSGTVTMNSQPVASGTITFVKDDGQLIREGAIIKDGSFEAQLPPGTYKIELHGQKVVSTRKQKGFDGKDEEVEITDELFPERYNAKTELSETFKPGANSLKLNLDGKK
jgi:hypothetical protein